MKKVFYSLTAVVFVLAFVACNNDNHEGFDTSTQRNIEARAAALGYDDVPSYEASVAQQCAEGNHKNCDIQTDGKHLVCGYAEHHGTNHNGTGHEGTDHGTHDANGHHNDHNGAHNGKHNNGGHNNGGHH